MTLHQRSIVNNLHLSVDSGDVLTIDENVDVPFMAARHLSTLLLQILDIIDHSPKLDNLSVGNECLVYLVSSVLAALTSICETFDFMNRKGRNHNPSVSYTSITPECNILKYLNMMSCGFLWLSSSFSCMDSILRKCGTNGENDVNLNSALARLAESALQRVAPVALYCLQCITGTLQQGNSVDSCLRLCLLLIHSAATLERTHRYLDEIISEQRRVSDQLETSFGGIDDDMLMAVDLDNLCNKSKQPKKIENESIYKILDFLSDALDQSKVSINIIICYASLPFEKGVCNVTFFHFHSHPGGL